jgi:hypothetical protein
MSYRRFGVLLAAIAAGLSACSGNRSLPIVGVHATPTAGAPTTSPSPVPSVAGSASVAAVATALASVESYYQTLPGTDPMSDVANVAAHMVSSGAFASATAGPGAISATLSDGTPVVLFTDRVADLLATSDALRANTTGNARRPSGVVVGPPPGTTIGPPTSHQILFLVNELDSAAFTPANQQQFGQAFSNLGFQSTGAQIDVAPVTLENIVALGSTHPLDFLDIATHGAVVSLKPGGPQFYANISNTVVSDASRALYASDLAAGRVLYAFVLTRDKTVSTFTTFAFTPAFVTEHATFNPGAIVDNESCFGQSPLIATAVESVYQLAGAGQYLGWTKPVAGPSADQTDAFLFDRMFGEQSPSQTGLDQFVPQRTPAQRPFALPFVEAVMQTELRANTIGTVTYAQDAYATNYVYPPSADGVYSHFIVSDFGSASIPNLPIEYGLPSIRFVDVDERTNPVMGIHGTFPSGQGSVTVTNASGTYPAPIETWEPEEVLVDIPNEGAGASGLVTVYSAPNATGVKSNSVPLTQWSGTATFTDNETITDLDGAVGSGSGSLAASFAFHFRADVQPAVVDVDTTPEPENFTFTDFEGDSAGSITSVSGSFTPAPQAGLPAGTAATFSLGTPGPIDPFSTASPPSSFDSLPVPAASAPASCNDATPGPRPGANDVSCRQFTFIAYHAIVCSDNDGNHLCLPPPLGNAAFILGEYHPAFLTLTLDPSTYAVSATLPAIASFPGAGFYESNGHDGDSTVNATLGITIGGPVDAPSSALRRRAPPPQY